MKTYVKPELRFESYELNHSVADCGWELQQGDVSTCNAIGDPDFGLVPEVTLFSEDRGCHITDYCYQNGEDGAIPLFRS